MKAATVVVQLLVLTLMAFTAFGQSVNTESVFSEVIERRKAKVQSLSVRIMPEKTTIASEEKKLTNGKTQVLSIPVALENWSSDEITSTISHEWYGGAHPPTDLYVGVRVLVEGKEHWVIQQVYLEGELDTSGVITLAPGEGKNLLIRLNWPGTGSVRVEPLIKATDVGEHMLKFFLLFKSAGNNCYVETPEIKIQVESASSENR